MFKSIVSSIVLFTLITLLPLPFITGCSSLSSDSTSAGKIAYLEQQLANKDREIESLKKQLSDLQGVNISPDTPVSVPGGALNLNAADLHLEGSQNSIAAEKKYKGQQLYVTGTAEEIRRRYDGAIMMRFVTAPNDTGWIECYSQNSDWEIQLSSVFKGQTITVKGEWDEWIGYILSLKNCSIIR